MSSSTPAILLIGVFPGAKKGRKAVCEELAERFASSGWTVFTASARDSRIGRLVDIVATCWRDGRRCDVAYVEVFSGPAFVWAEAACGVLRRIGCPYVLTLHGGNLPDFASGRPGRVARLLRSAVRVTTPSRYLYERMRQYQDDLLLLPNAIELDDYVFRPRLKFAPKLVWVRSFHSIYNPQLAIHTAALLREKFPQLELTMIGPDKDGSLEATRQLAAECGLVEQVQFTGGMAKDEIPGWLNRADIFLNTTNIDNTPLSVLEAMACGLGVVSTNVGGIPYLLNDRQDSLLVPPADPAAMAAAVTELLTNPDLASRLAASARRTAEQFGWSSILPQWLELVAPFDGRKAALAS